MNFGNIFLQDTDTEKRFLLTVFELKVKLATLNSELMGTQLENYIKNYAESTPEQFGKDLKKYLHNKETISGETIRNIINKAKLKKDNNNLLLSNERTRVFLELFNIIADNAIVEKGNFALKNKLSLDFFKYPGDEELKTYIINNNLFDSFTSNLLLEYIISKHDEISEKISAKYQPRIISKQLYITGKIIKKYEWNIRYSDNLFEKQSILKTQDFNSVYLPKDVTDIFTGIDETIITFMSNHLRFLRLVSRYNTPEKFAKLLGIEDTSLVQYETTHHKLNDSMICKLVDYYSNEKDPKFRILFDYFFTEISLPKFAEDSELRTKFSELIDDYTFLKYTKFQHDNSNKKDNTEKKIETKRKTVRTNIRQETIDLLENEIKYFVMQTFCFRSGNEIKPFYTEVQERFSI